MQHSYIVAACRTPIGRLQGALAAKSATDLGAVAVGEAVRRSQLPPELVSEVIMGNVLSAGVGQAPARQAALQAGLPSSVAALTINKVCGSGLKAVMLADQAIRCEAAEVVVAGGMESMSNAPWLLPRKSVPLGDRLLIDSLMHDGLTCSFSQQAMGDIAEDLAALADISREAQDRYAVESQRRASEAIAAGAFAAETAPVSTSTKKGSTEVTQDEGPREDTTFERLATLPTVFQKKGTVTAGNASMISDGAAALVVAPAATAEQHGVQPLAKILATATSGGEPHSLFTAPVEAIRMVAAKSGHPLDSFDLFEINEAFAVQMLACLAELELPHDRVNVHGGAIALGHPIGASGARVLVTLLHALSRRGGSRGIAALCLGGGNAVAVAVETVELRH